MALFFGEEKIKINLGNFQSCKLNLTGGKIRKNSLRTINNYILKDSTNKYLVAKEVKNNE